MKADQLRSEADPERIAKLLAAIPPAEQINPSAGQSVNIRDTHKIPKQPEKAHEWLIERLKTEQENLTRDQEIYEMYRIKGLDMVSDSDLIYAIGANATEAGIQALENCFFLKTNHISNRLGTIASLRKELSRLDNKLKTAKDVKTAPKGYEVVDVVLPSHQAFIVRKWAEAAKSRIASGKK